MSWWLLASLIIGGFDVFVKMARQSGKTETLTLLVRFLLIFYRLILKRPLMAAFASPKGEQAKTDVDRIKKSIQQLREGWQVEDREFNSKTIRAYRFDKLFAEIFTFSLSPTTQNESKTLNLGVFEEAHNIDDVRRSDQIDPMLASTGGSAWYFGVGCTVVCDFKRGCDGDFIDGVGLVIDCDQIFLDRRKMYRQTGDPIHLAYEKKITAEIRKKGRQNPEIRRNYYVEDTVEEGNFISRERLQSCARKAGVTPPLVSLYLGVDWARSSDHTWCAVGTETSVVDWLKVEHLPYERQVEIIKEWLYAERKDGEKAFRYIDRILAVRGDSTGGTGDAPNEMLAAATGLPMDKDSLFQFTMQSKNELYLNFELALFRDGGDPLRFSYPPDHPLAGEFEEQMVALEREYIGQGEYLSVHHPDEIGAKDDAPDATALMLMASLGGVKGDIVVG